MPIGTAAVLTGAALRWETVRIPALASRGTPAS
jgi:hypothetical protein